MNRRKKFTLFGKITSDLEAMEIGSTIDLKEFIRKYWDDASLLSTRSFDVYYCKAKAILKEKGMTFKRKNGTSITRMS